ncbi:MAG: glycosyltransferase family 4 protein, partial [Rhodospirillales bacterium]|nr:glycosyltransferase family 4 protein [Rhodospirillales bacterium]
ERIIGMNECGPKIGVIASLGNRYKGIQVALAAMVAVVQVYPRATLNILGPGDISPWFRMAERLNIVENVVFHGTCSPGEPVLSWLDTMDIYIQPSLQEGLPRALIEAMSRGLPSIATHIAGIPELLTDEDMIEPNNAKALASKLVEKMGSVSWRLESSNRNVQTSLNYEREVLLAKRTDFYTDFARVCNEKQV